MVLQCGNSHILPLMPLIVDDDDQILLPSIKGFAISTANGIGTINNRSDIEMPLNAN